jgi:hypothetical protein
LQYCHLNVEKCFGCSGLLKYQHSAFPLHRKI